MHIDLGSCACRRILIVATIFALNRFGMEHKSPWDWRYFAAIFVAILILNLVWPVGG